MKSFFLVNCAVLIGTIALAETAFASSPVACANLQRKAIVCSAGESDLIRSIEFPADKMMVTVNFANGSIEQIKRGTMTESAFPTYGFRFSAGSVDFLPTYCQDDLLGSFYWQHIVGGRALLAIDGMSDPLILNCIEGN